MSGCDSKEGVDFIASENVVADRIAASTGYTGLRSTDKHSRVDRIYSDATGTIRSLVEIKTRPEHALADFDRIQTVWVDEHKIEDGVMIAKMICAPFFIFVRTLKDDAVFFVKICDEKGSKLVQYETVELRAPKNCHGGEMVEKRRAFLPIGAFTVFDYDGKQRGMWETLEGTQQAM